MTAPQGSRQPLALYSHYWRRRFVLDLEAQQRALMRHRTDIQEMRVRLDYRVSGIEAALSFLDQAADALRESPDALPAPRMTRSAPSSPLRRPGASEAAE
jgi:hypothetical protein